MEKIPPSYKILIGVITLVACSFKFSQLKPLPKLSDNVTFAPISYEKATAIFDTMAHLPFIEFNYANNHCEDRAHAMAHLIEKEGVSVAKVWIFVKGIFDNKYPKVLKVKDFKDTSEKEYLTWKYHVAPVIVVSNENQLDTLVIDPSLCEKPVTFLEWLEKMNAKGDVNREDVFFLIKDWKYQTYVTKNKVPKILEPWKVDPNFYMTRKGLCEGKILYDYFLEQPRDSTIWERTKKFDSLPSPYQRERTPCMQGLQVYFE